MWRWRGRYGALTTTLVTVAGCTYGCKSSVSDYDEPRYGCQTHQPSVALVDAGIRVSRATGMDPQWPKYYATSSNQRPFEIDALPGETAAFQIVIASGVDGLEGVSIDTTAFPNFGLCATEPVEIFLVHEIPIQRRSGGQRLHESLGWASSAMPRAPRPPTTIADALIPIAHAPHWAPYPSQIPARSSQAFWVDLRIPESGTFPITKFGTLRVRSQAGMLASIPIKVSVGSTPLPYAAARTMLYFDPQEIVKRVGTAEAVD